ncbi:MAG: TIGR03960 family B12-binding radical SAM protein [Pirellulales bacterium]|nr:TIGR03960 family B12-binding radical SAM protein [Pirellulales bacterium]
MLSQSLKDQIIRQLMADIQTPGQYIGGELNAVARDHGSVRGSLCLAFPDTYSIGMSCHGLQVLYGVMNRRDDWACERVFAPLGDMEQMLRREGLPLASLETFTPLDKFDVVGFTLQYELCGTNVLTMLDLGRIPLHVEDRTEAHPLVIAGGPYAATPEPLAPFIDLFVIGDGEEMLPRVCEAWLEQKALGRSREEALAATAAELPHIYVPRFYEPDARTGRPRPTRPGLAERIEPAVVADLDATPLPCRPVVPNVETVHDRIAIEIMRGCPWQCRFCQSSPAKRPVRFRRVETIVEAALQSYRNTGYNEISLLSLSTSDYPHLAELLTALQAMFRPKGVSIAVPSLRVNEQLQMLGELLNTDRRGGVTIAPEAARDEMRRRIGKRITNDDLYEGCRQLFAKGFDRVKLYFMCGLPGETEDDLAGILEMAETISRLGREVSGRLAQVTASVSNFVPKPHTPLQFGPMQSRDYFRKAHRFLFDCKRLRSVQVKRHDLECSLLEGVLGRGDRRVGRALETVWRRGARFDAWHEHLDVEGWWKALGEAGVDVDAVLHRARSTDEPLPWDHVGIRQGRDHLVEQWNKANR